jgi:hypothetical protein
MVYSPYMLVYKCDACGKILPKRNDSSTLTVGLGFALNHLCAKCAAPIIRVLKGYKLTK